MAPLPLPILEQGGLGVRVFVPGGLLVSACVPAVFECGAHVAGALHAGASVTGSGAGSDGASAGDGPGEVGALGRADHMRLIDADA